MWLIVGTSPQLPKGHLAYGKYDVATCRITLSTGDIVSVERGFETLAATADTICKSLNTEPPLILCASDQGSGDGSKKAYAYLIEHLKEINPTGITFHYLFPDVDWHNKVLMSIEELPKRPVLVADAGFMYVAKMSGYSDQYDLFTPDLGEMSFLADELAPHPFYTRGFLLGKDSNAENLLERAKKHDNISKNLIIKGSTDYLVFDGEIAEKVSEPSVPAMECIGGTGDLVTGIVTGLLASNMPMQEACRVAVKTNRTLAEIAKPNPATAVGTLMPFLDQALAANLKS